MKQMKTYQKRFEKMAKKASKNGRKFAMKNQYGIFFSVLTFVTIMVGMSEYMVRETDQFLAEFNVIKPSAVSDNVQYAKKTEERKLAGQAPKAHKPIAR